MIGGPPHFLARVLVESNDSGGFAADIQQQQVPFDKRRGGDAEESFWNLVVGIHGPLPDLFSAHQLQTVQMTLCAKGVDVVAGDERRGTRPLVHAEIVSVTARIGTLPLLLA